MLDGVSLACLDAIIFGKVVVVLSDIGGEGVYKVHITCKARNCCSRIVGCWMEYP